MKTDSASQKWIAVARVLRPRGNKGEVAAELLTDFPERLTKIQEIFLRSTSGNAEPRRVGLRSFWVSQNHRGQGVFHFADSNSIDDAEKLRGCEVLLPFEQRVHLAAGQYFITELMGCSVFEVQREASQESEEHGAVASSPCSLASAPMHLGTVRDVQFTGETSSGTPLLVVDTANGELLVPLAQDICTRIDLPARRIEVALPEGLRELNAG